MIYGNKCIGRQSGCVLFISKKLFQSKDRQAGRDRHAQYKYMTPFCMSGSITEMLESAEYVLSDVDLIAQFVFKMKKLKWLHLTSPGNDIIGINRNVV